MATAPPFAYFGGKTNLAQKIVDLLPAHRHYVEPFAGSLAVLLAKPRVDMETVNDLDGDLMTFWRVLRDRPHDLALHMALTPHSRAEHQAAYDLAVEDDLERARRVWVLLSQGRHGRLTSTGWSYVAKPSIGISKADYLTAYTQRVPACARRLQGVSLECRDAHEVIRDYGQHDEVLLYCDPPYLGSTRSANYRHEMTSDADHERLAESLHQCRAAVVLSGYHSPLYDRLYDSWHRIEMSAWTGNGIREGRTVVDGLRTEVLWSNRPLGEPDLFSVDGEA